MRLLHLSFHLFLHLPLHLHQVIVLDFSSRVRCVRFSMITRSS